MLFDYDDDTIRVESPYPSGVLRLTPGIARPSPSASPVGRRGYRGRAVPAATSNRPALGSPIDSPTPGEPILIPNAPHREMTSLPHRTRVISVSAFPAIPVAAMDNFGADLRTYFPEV